MVYASPAAKSSEAGYSLRVYAGTVEYRLFAVPFQMILWDQYGHDHDAVEDFPS